jgi:hypothetical protein
MLFDSVFLYAYFEVGLDCIALIPHAIFHHLAKGNQNHMALMSSIRTVGTPLLQQLTKTDPPYSCDDYIFGGVNIIWRKDRNDMFSIVHTHDYMQFRWSIGPFIHIWTLDMFILGRKMESLFQLDSTLRRFQQRLADHFPTHYPNDLSWDIEDEDYYLSDVLRYNLVDDYLTINGRPCRTPLECDQQMDMLKQ